MKTTKTPYLFPILAFIFGLAATKSFMAALILSFVSYIVQTFASIQWDAEDYHADSGSTFDNDFTHILILLSAEVIKADQRIYPRELELVRLRLAHEFDPRTVEKYMQDLRLCLKKKVKVESLCKQIRFRLTQAEKLQLLNFLTGLTVTNGKMIDYEYDLLRKIAYLIDISDARFHSILALFRFERIRTYSKEQKSQSRPKTRTTSLSSAYAILEINENASDEDVKKAYRKLAKLHHPDRVHHLGKEFQKSAQIKFQKIADAYELIKSKRGMK